MTAKLERDAAEEAKRDALVPEYQELTKAERFEKLKNLLAKSKFYSNYLLDKMNKEDEASKALKDKQLSDRRKKRKSQVDSPLRPSAKKPRKHAGRRSDHYPHFLFLIHRKITSVKTIYLLIKINHCFFYI